MSENDYTERLSKCYTGVVHDIMRDYGHKNFTLPSSIRPSKNKYILAGQIFTMEGIVDQTLDHHETLLAWTGFLSKAPNNKVVICQPNNHEVALMGELSAETLQLKGVRGYIVDGGARDLDFILKIDFPLWSSFYTPRDVVGFWKPTDF
jgi:regulator of RNase E activity RraA